MALDFLVQAVPPSPPPPTRLIEERDGELFLVALDSIGGCDIVGPITRHEECERMARTLLAVAGPGLCLPDALHRLCVAYLAARGVERLP